MGERRALKLFGQEESKEERKDDKKINQKIAKQKKDIDHDGTEYVQKKTKNMMMEVAVIVFSCFSIFALGHLVLSSSLEKARRG
jgi:seryl-tRNA(Sec) selenium transferase